MTNGIRKVRLGADIFNKRILDSCKFILDSPSEYGLVSGNLFLAAGRVQTDFKVYGTQPIRILNSMFPFSLFLARGKGKRSIEKPLLSLHYYFLFFQVGCTVMFYSTQGSVQPQKKWRELYKNLTVLSSLDAYT